MNELDNLISKDEDDLDLKRIILDVLKHWWIIAISTLTLGLLAFAYCALLKTPMYVSKTGMYVMSSDKNGNISYSDTQLATQLTKDYAQLIVSRTVLETVTEQCGLNISYENMKAKVSVSNLKETRIIEISVKDSDPQRAQELAEHIRIVATEQIKSVTGVQLATTVDKASLPKVPVEPSKKKWLMIGLALGFALSTVVLVVCSVLDDTIKTAEDVDRRLGWSTLALIPMIELEDRTKNSKKNTSRKPVKKRTQSMG